MSDPAVLWSRLDWIIAVTPKCAAAISIPSSAFVIYVIYCDRKKKRELNSIERTILFMTMFDLFAAMAWFTSTWASPIGYGPMSAGNRTTCDIQGFLIQLAVGAPLYNSVIAFYYLLVIKYKWTNRKLAVIEHRIHAIVLIFSFISAASLIPLNLYNYSGPVCWIIGDPVDCDGSSYFLTGVPCDRGNKAWILSLSLFHAPLCICTFVCIYSMGCIAYEVWRTYSRMGRYTTENNPRSRKTVMRVGEQAILYSLAFLITWIPSILWSVAHAFNWSHFVLDFFSVLCEPLQGFWIFIIFVRMRSSTKKKIRKALSFCFCCFLKRKKRIESRISISNSNNICDSEMRENELHPEAFAREDEMYPGPYGDLDAPNQNIHD